MLVQPSQTMLTSALTQSSVLDLPVHLCENYLSWLRSRLQENKGVQVVTLNSEMAMLAKQTPQLHQVIQNAELVVPDGAGVIFYLRLRKQHQQRCPGIELAGSLIGLMGTENPNSPIIFYGGAPGVTDQAAQYWKTQYPDLNIITQHGFLSPEEQETFKQFLKNTQPKVILVGLGVPRQEYWIAEHRALCPNAIWIGVGGSFDIWAGVKTRAPEWLRNNHLEWLYRLYKEPWRWRRMLVLPRFAWKAVLYR